MTITDSNLLIFKAITSFINDLSEIYGENQKSLLLYAHLIEKTGIIHEEPIKKHIKAFREFILTNEDAIFKKDITLITEPIVQYSEKVFIDIKSILEIKDDDQSNKDNIWKHLLTLTALLNPSSQAKHLLQQEKEKKTEHNEEDFLTSLIDKVGQHIDPTVSNPMETMNSLMSSGVFNELMTNMDQGIGNGSLDMTKLVGSLQNMIGSLSTMMDNNNNVQTPTLPSLK